MCIWPILFQGKESLFIAPSFNEQGTSPLITKGKRKKERQSYNDCRRGSLDSERNKEENEIYLRVQMFQFKGQWHRFWNHEAYPLASRATAELFHLTLSERILSVLQAPHMVVSQRAFEGVIKVVIIHIFLIE